jgi:hypothetical protein
LNKLNFEQISINFQTANGHLSQTNDRVRVMVTGKAPTALAIPDHCSFNWTDCFLNRDAGLGESLFLIDCLFLRSHQICVQSKPVTDAHNGQKTEHFSGFDEWVLHL